MDVYLFRLLLEYVDLPTEKLLMLRSDTDRENTDTLGCKTITERRWATLGHFLDRFDISLECKNCKAKPALTYSNTYRRGFEANKSIIIIIATVL